MEERMGHMQKMGWREKQEKQRKENLGLQYIYKKIQPEAKGVFQESLLNP